MKKFLGLLMIFTHLVVWGQNPVKWSITATPIENNKYQVDIKATIEDGWHLYGQYMEMSDQGPLPSLVSFESQAFNLIGKTEEIGIHAHYEDVFKMEVTYFEKEGIFRQLVEQTNSDSVILNGKVNFMVCRDGMCLPPDDYFFKINVLENNEVVESIEYKTDSNTLAIIPAVDNVNLQSPINDCGEIKQKKSYTNLFLFGLIFGMLSLFTPCVFPMIPLTVSFFTKGGSEKGKGTGKALLYGLSIVGVYVSLSLPFYAPGTNPELLNEIATSFTLNIIFFLIFIFFALSFFGYYEITLPSSWANKADKAADKGGLIGVIFMAIVLAIVSFSCTGPLLGAVLGESLKDGPVPITFAMLGFGIGLGFPFTIFALFPALLKSLPQSGGWLNTVKVVLGFVELALALKFLSNADYVYQFEFIERETFFLIWILVSLGTFAYLMGWFNFPHDDKGAKISSTRKLIAIPFLLFAIYLIPGVLPSESQKWSTSMVSGFPPATNYSWYDQGTHHFLNFEDALIESQKTGKPILIDFTGYACVNCRKMEENVWTNPKVAELLNQYIVVSLYVDDKNDLPKEQQGEVTITLYNGEKKQKSIKTIGNKWATFESIKFGQVSQPYYVQLSSDQFLLSNPVGYTPDASAYAEWLACGLDGDKKIKSGQANLNLDAKKEEVRVADTNPTKWSVKTKKTEKNELIVSIYCDLEPGWHTYSTKMEMTDEGPLPSWVSFETNDNFELLGELIEENAHTAYDETWKMNITDFSGQAIFKQKIKVKTGEVFVLKGNVNYMVCQNGMCLPPADAPFEIRINE